MMTGQGNKIRVVVFTCIVHCFTSFLAVVADEKASVSTLPGKPVDWHGFERHDFSVDGRSCTVVRPKFVAPGRPWVWRARFFGHEPQVDLELLANGFHLAYMDVAGLFGSPQAVRHWNRFYAYLIENQGFAPKAVLEGMSRGGLIVYNWAAQNADKVACIYADAPVCDFKSWPAGKGASAGSPAAWRQCLGAYGLTEAQALAYGRNPIDNLRPLAEAKVPLLHVCGDADEVVPVKENTAIVEQRYKKLGGSIEVIHKAGVGHHPHSLSDPMPITEFILRHALGTQRDYFSLRDDLSNCRFRFAKNKAGRVAFLGGSITEMTGWRDRVCQDLEARFPETRFGFINAGISSTDSTLGPFRLRADVFGRGRVDLLFVEFAVNDPGNGRSEIERIRGMEGVIRQARRINPEIDIVMMYFVDPGKMEKIRSGRRPPEIASHDKVARYYRIPSINLAREVTDRIDAGEFNWKKFGGLHPAPFGHAVYARSIGRMFDAAWHGPIDENARLRRHWSPDRPIDPLHYGRGRTVDLDRAKLITGWKSVASWNTRDGQNRKRFQGIRILEAIEPGATLTLPFEGSAVGIYVLAGPDVGMLEFSLDGGRFETIDQFTQWSPRLHIPWAYMLKADLKRGQHVLTLRTGDRKNEASRGHACRIMRFLVN